MACWTTSGAPAASTSPATSAPAWPAGSASAWRRSACPRVRQLRGLPGGPRRGVRPALRHDPDQRHGLLPRRRRPGRSLGREIVPLHPGRASAHGRPGPRSGVPAAPPGEEAYTLAIVLAEAMGIGAGPRSRQDLRDRPGRPRPGPGPPGQLRRPGRWRGCPPTTWPGTSTPRPAGTPSRRNSAAAVIFGRHDLIQDAPISRIDLLCLPQRPDVLQHRDAVAHPRPLPLRAE